MIRELILFRPFFSLLLLLSFSPFCTYEPTFQIHPSDGQEYTKYDYTGSVAVVKVEDTLGQNGYVYAYTITRTPSDAKVEL